jgi:hypothetical protein
VFPLALMLISFAFSFFIQFGPDEAKQSVPAAELPEGQ